VKLLPLLAMQLPRSAIDWLDPYIFNIFIMLRETQSPEDLAY